MDDQAMTGPLETKAMYPLGLAPTITRTRPPMARVAAESAAEAALRDLSDEIGALRSEGRMVLRLALGAVDDSYLIRDRLADPPEETAALTDSLRSHGQRMPVEVVDLGHGRFGLISGWRRLSALRRLAAEDPARFGHVLALVRAPASAADAYVAMVEENEIRAGLSYWERARVVVQACAAGVFGSEKIALQRLFANASRARRSKIGAFLGLVKGLDGILRFPADLPERAGLALAQALERDAGLPARLSAALKADPPGTASAEQACIAAVLASGKGGKGTARGATARRDLAPGLWVQMTGKGEVTLGGPAVDAGFLARLEAWAQGHVPGETPDTPPDPASGT